MNLERVAAQATKAAVEHYLRDQVMSELQELVDGLEKVQRTTSITPPPGLAALVARLAAVVGAPPPLGDAEGIKPRLHDEKPGTLLEAVRGVLQDAPGRQVTSAEVYEALRESGWEFRGNNPRNVINNTLARATELSPQIAKVGRARYVWREEAPQCLSAEGAEGSSPELEQQQNDDDDSMDKVVVER
jgi:hypothetical protein